MSREPWEERASENLLKDRPFCAMMPKPETELTEAMQLYLKGRDLDFRLAQNNGWYTSRRAGDYEPRIVIPATAGDPANKYWQARAMEEGVDLRYTSPPNPRGDAIVIVWPTKQGPSTAVVAEGPMDALGAAGEGYIGVGLMGTGVPLSALDLMLKLLKGIANYIAVMDEDQPEAMVSVMRYMSNKGALVKIVRPYPFKDIAAANPEARRFLFQSVVGGN